MAYNSGIILAKIVTEDCNRPQHDLNILHKWATTWRMSFNVTNFYYVRFTNKQHIINYTYHIHNHDLEECNVIKYLGVLIDDKLTWSAHANYTVKKTNETLCIFLGSKL